MLFCLVQAERYFHLLDILVGANQPVLLTGAPGIGKTALIQVRIKMQHVISMSLLEDYKVMCLKNQGGGGGVGRRRKKKIIFLTLAPSYKDPNESQVLLSVASL